MEFSFHLGAYHTCLSDSKMMNWDFLLAAPLTWHHTEYLKEYFARSWVTAPPPDIRGAFQARLLAALRLHPVTPGATPLAPAQEFMLLDALHRTLYQGKP